MKKGLLITFVTTASMCYAHELFCHWITVFKTNTNLSQFEIKKYIVTDVPSDAELHAGTEVARSERL